MESQPLIRSYIYKMENVIIYFYVLSIYKCMTSKNKEQVICEEKYWLQLKN